MLQARDFGSGDAPWGLAAEGGAKGAASASHAVAYDRASGVVICRIRGQLDDAEVQLLAAELDAAVEEARRNSPVLRLLWDNRDGFCFTSGAARELADRVRADHRPEDRTALLVSSSLMKVKVRQHTGEGREIFLSESAAMTWLEAWK